MAQLWFVGGESGRRAIKDTFMTTTAETTPETLDIIIVAETPMGYADADWSIKIPLHGQIPKERDCPGLTPCLTTFGERFCRASDRPPRSFTAVRVRDFYMLWIKERHEWVGIEYRFLGRGDYEQNIYGGGHEERMETEGPFRLGEWSGRAILKAYGRPPIAPVEAVSTSPSEIATRQEPKHRNLQRWRTSDGPRSWVKAQNGKWNHEDWLKLLDSLKGSEFWPMEPA